MSASRPVPLHPGWLDAEKRRLGRILGAEAAVSVLGGAHLWFHGGLRFTGGVGGAPLVRDLGRQTVMWGAVNGGIAALGERGRRRALGTPVKAGATARQARRLRRILLVNAGLDIGYLAVGAALVAKGERLVLDAVEGTRFAPLVGDRRPPGRGDGVAVLAQGAFLLWLDTSSAGRLA